MIVMIIMTVITTIIISSKCNRKCPSRLMELPGEF
jgi:hypothetical protein